MNSSLQRAADPVYNTVPVPLDGSQLAAGAMRTACALPTRFRATVHTVTVAISDLEPRRIRSKAADALGTDPDDAHIHVEVDTDIAGALFPGMKDHLAAHPAGLIAVTSHLRDPLAHLMFGSGAADIIHTSTAPALVVPVPAVQK